MPNADPSVIKSPERIAALHALNLLDSGPENAFDRLTSLAAAVTKSPVSLFTLIDEDRAFYKSAFGLPEPWFSQRQSPLSHSFCQHVVATGQQISFEDARFHPLGEDSPAVREMNAIAYLGVPLALSNGIAIGAFALIDNKPRLWSAQDILIAQELAASVVTEIDLRQQLANSAAAGPFGPIFKSTPDLIWVTDSEFRVVEINGAAKRFFNIDSSDVPGLRVEAFLGNESYQFLRNEAFRVANETSMWAGELYFSRFDGHQIPVSVVILAHYGESRESDRWSVVARDISSIREAEHALQKALEQEQRLTRLQGRFINTISHEFRNPLSMILSSLELLIRHGSRTDPSSHYERMKKGVRDIASTLDRGIRLLDDAEDETPPEIGEIALDAFAKQLIDGVTQNYEGRVVQLEVPPDPTIVRLDVAAIRGVAEQLLANALKFSTVGSMVALKFALRDCDEAAKTCQLVMYVRDRGIGIPEDDQPFIFERFYRAYNLPNVSGIGAGLYHVKRLIERLDGKIEFFSRVGEGTEFVIMVPVENLSPKPKVPSGRRASNATQSPSA